MTHPLVAEATKKAAVAWVAVADQPARALWCMGVEGAVVLVSGPGEQTAPGVESAREALVSLRGDHGGRIITWRAAVTRIEPGTEEWTELVPLLAGKRLNAPVDAATLVERWAAECTVQKLTPVGEPVEASPDLAATAEAAPPRDTPARRRTAAPFRLHRVRRR